MPTALMVLMVTAFPTGLGLTDTMVSGTEQNYHYASGLPNDLSRPSAIREGSTDIATYRYLGLGSFIGVDYPGPAVALTYQHGSSGDAGDQYTGLDRVGRVIDLRWNKSGTALVSSQYGYDRNSNQRWRKDAAGAAASVNTEDQMFYYDGLQQVYQRQRGTLTPGSPPYTGISSIQQTEVFSFDETGNWLTDYNSTGRARRKPVRKTGSRRHGLQEVSAGWRGFFPVLKRNGQAGRLCSCFGS